VCAGFAPRRDEGERQDTTSVKTLITCPKHQIFFTGVNKRFSPGMSLIMPSRKFNHPARELARALPNEQVTTLFAALFVPKMI